MQAIFSASPSYSDMLDAVGMSQTGHFQTLAPQRFRACQGVDELCAFRDGFGGEDSRRSESVLGLMVSSARARLGCGDRRPA